MNKIRKFYAFGLGAVLGFLLWFAMNFVPGIAGTNTLGGLITIYIAGGAGALIMYFLKQRDIALVLAGVIVGVTIALPVASQFIGIL